MGGREKCKGKEKAIEGTVEWVGAHGLWEATAPNRTLLLRLADSYSQVTY